MWRAEESKRAVYLAGVDQLLNHATQLPRGFGISTTKPAGCQKRVRDVREW